MIGSSDNHRVYGLVLNNFHMMHKEITATFSAPWFKKFGIKPFPIDLQTMDLEGGTFIEELKDSLKAGYDPSRPIIVAIGDDARVSGNVIDGRHRLYCLAKLHESGVPLPSPFPKGEVEVKSPDHYRALVASYESRGMSKGSRYAKAYIQKNLTGIAKDHLELEPKSLKELIRSLGFKNEALASKIIDDYQGPQKKPKKQRYKLATRGLPESLATSWTRDSSPVYAKNDEPLDLIVSYHNCPDCETHLKVTTTLNGNVLRIESAIQISK